MGVHRAGVCHAAVDGDKASLRGVVLVVGVAAPAANGPVALEAAAVVATDGDVRPAAEARVIAIIGVAIIADKAIRWLAGGDAYVGVAQAVIVFVLIPRREWVDGSVTVIAVLIVGHVRPGDSAAELCNLRAPEAIAIRICVAGVGVACAGMHEAIAVAVNRVAELFCIWVDRRVSVVTVGATTA